MYYALFLLFPFLDFQYQSREGNDTQNEDEVTLHGTLPDAERCVHDDRVPEPFTINADGIDHLV